MFNNSDEQQTKILKKQACYLKPPLYKDLRGMFVQEIKITKIHIKCRKSNANIEVKLFNLILKHALIKSNEKTFNEKLN